MSGWSRETLHIFISVKTRVDISSLSRSLGWQRVLIQGVIVKYR